MLFGLNWLIDILPPDGGRPNCILHYLPFYQSLLKYLFVSIHSYSSLYTLCHCFAAADSCFKLAPLFLVDYSHQVGGSGKTAIFETQEALIYATVVHLLVGILTDLCCVHCTLCTMHCVHCRVRGWADRIKVIGVFCQVICRTVNWRCCCWWGVWIGHQPGAD